MVSALVVADSAVLAAFEQQAVSVFTANSRAFHAYLRDHPNAFLIGTTNNERAVNFFSMMENRLDLRNRVASFGDASTAPNSGKDVFAALDLQTIDGLRQPYLSALQPVSTPLPAHLFRVDPTCLPAPQQQKQQKTHKKEVKSAYSPRRMFISSYYNNSKVSSIIRLPVA